MKGFVERVKVALCIAGAFGVIYLIWGMLDSTGSDLSGISGSDIYWWWGIVSRNIGLISILIVFIVFMFIFVISQRKRK